MANVHTQILAGIQLRRSNQDAIPEVNVEVSFHFSPWMYLVVDEVFGVAGEEGSRDRELARGTCGNHEWRWFQAQEHWEVHTTPSNADCEMFVYPLVFRI